MKGEQDSLERRLWAKQEKIKRTQDESHQAERDMCVSSSVLSSCLSLLWRGMQY